MLVSVLIPMTPIPATGFLVHVPEGDVQELSMSVRDAMRLIVSSGIIDENKK